MFRKIFLTASVALALCSCEDKKEDNTGILFFLLSQVGAGSSETSNTATSCKNETFCRTFIATNNGAGYTGDLGGISGADAKCAAAKPSSLTGTYKALIVSANVRQVVSAFDGSVDKKDWILYPNKQYRRSDGTTITFTTNTNSIVVDNLQNGIDSGAQKFFWNGLGNDVGFLWEPSANCNNWNSANNGFTGQAGNTTELQADKTPTGTFTVDTHNCNSTLNLLCIEQ
ncbi:DUF1554 domain-containing protein [Leptospira santarosai]|uniref:endostatin-like outer membrane protein, LenA/LenB family n=1 Tax=Leptospira santarosai TaxID=28183 RepID=UPI0024AF845E|nr:DUF1554 domain-containing protein [Leptospira santarosai]MDI7187570.1 DUF1554 domain-containing protein [Leptospira santarosai]MDI7200244.1 DUF1554 domain-containing protein [Leptospira santarosai]